MKKTLSKSRAFNSARTTNLPHWLTVRNQANGPTEMVISGRIGKDWWDDSGTSSKEFRDELKSIPAGRKINVRINSEGGSIQDGLEIYNALKDRRADVTCYVDGYAVSIASVIALAGARTVSPKSSIWMIHEPWCMTQGNSDDMLRSAEMLDKHGDMLAAIYAEETGKSKTEMRDAMRQESWFTGEEAQAFGLSDETPDDAVALAALDAKNYRNVPAPILAIISAADGNGVRNSLPPLTPTAARISEPATPIQGSATTNHQTPHIMDKKLVIAALKQRGIEVPDNATDEQLLALMAQQPAAAQPKPAAATLPTNVVSVEVFNAEKRKRIKAAVISKGENKIPNDQIDNWVENAMENEERTMAMIDSMPSASIGGESVGRVVIASENPMETIRKMPTPLARYNHMRDNWEELFADAGRRDNRRAMNTAGTPGNTFSSTITTSFLTEGATTKLQNMLAPLRSFTKDYSTDPYKPKATGVLKYVTAATDSSGSATGKNLTNFEDGDSTVTAVSVAVDQYTRPFNVSNSDLQGGLRMENLVDVNVAKFADIIMTVAMAPITVANFGTTAGTTGAAAPLVSSSGSFGFSDLATLWGGLKKSAQKYALLDGEYLARIINNPGLFQAVGTEGGAGWKIIGWDGIYLNTNWSGAATGVRGIALNPQAIGAIAGLPVAPTQNYNGSLNISTFTVPGVGISVALYNWFSLQSRAMWCSYDVMLGTKEMDLTAATLIKDS